MHDNRLARTDKLTTDPGFPESARGAVPGLLLAISPCRSPNPPCASRRNGLSAVPAVRLVREPRGLGCYLRGSGTG